MKTAKTAGPTSTRDLTPDRTDCPRCGRHMTADYANRRTIHTLSGVTRLNLTIRRYHNSTCPAHKKPYRPEAEGSFALPRPAASFDPQGGRQGVPRRAPPVVPVPLPA